MFPGIIRSADSWPIHLHYSWTMIRHWENLNTLKRSMYENVNLYPTFKGTFHFLVSWYRVVPQQSIHGHYNSWSAKSTLGSMKFNYPLLQYWRKKEHLKPCLIKRFPNSRHFRNMLQNFVDVWIILHVTATTIKYSLHVLAYYQKSMHEHHATFAELRD